MELWASGFSQERAEIIKELCTAVALQRLSVRVVASDALPMGGRVPLEAAAQDVPQERRRAQAPKCLRELMEDAGFSSLGQKPWTSEGFNGLFDGFSMDF